MNRIVQTPLLIAKRRRWQHGPALGALAGSPLLVLVLACGATEVAPRASLTAQGTEAARNENASDPSGTTGLRAARCSSPLIDDFEDGDGRPLAVDGRSGAWRTFKDPSGTTILPDNPVRPDPMGANGSHHAVHVHGEKAGAPRTWAGLALDFVDPLAAYDLSAASGVCFQGKGSGIVRVAVSDENTDPAGGKCSMCYNLFGAFLELTPDWTEHCVRFDALKQVPGWGHPRPKALFTEATYTLSWGAPGRGEPFDFWIDDVRLSCE